ncbi:TetR/AcrR family transcriptional regulator [Nonomuraea sp. NPDC049309]|uniref:TetR/AcrR family transcriptional regulator n=1 Tax=Nonomuraea sp. NPDC049309 TaxID=3364350 RepID=UPI003723924B
MSGLRERWRLKAMRAIQEHALDLFDERGFDSVTIEEIAAAAEVSPSTVYRIFGTKEGIVVTDIEFDAMSPEALAAIFDPADPVGSLVQAVRAYETPREERQAGKGPWRRVRYFFATPSVRMAVCATLDQAGRRITPLIAETGKVNETQARVIANALAFGYFAALEQWYLNGGDQPIAAYVEDGLRPLRDVLGTSS